MSRRVTKKKPSKTKKLPKSVRSISAGVRSTIVDLSELLYDFIPISSRSPKSETFYTIFKQSGIHAYFPKNTPKKPALEKGLIKLFRYHEKLPHSIFRKIVPAAIKHRRYKRNPLKREEVNQLAEILLRLGVDLRKEFKEIELDEFMPLIVVPPTELVRRLENHPLCDQVKSEPLDLFKNGHFNESVRKASEKFEVEIQSRANSTDIGKNLMGKAFNLAGPLIALNSQITENEKGIQEGFQFLTMGMIRSMRNIFSHGDENQRSPEEAFEMLIFINWLFRQLPE